MRIEHSINGEVKDKPTVRMVCGYEDKSYRVFDPSDFEFCPMCGGALD